MSDEFKECVRRLLSEDSGVRVLGSAFTVANEGSKLVLSQVEALGGNLVSVRKRVVVRAAGLYVKRDLFAGSSRSHARNEQLVLGYRCERNEEF